MYLIYFIELNLLLFYFITLLILIKIVDQIKWTTEWKYESLTEKINKYNFRANA